MKHFKITILFVLLITQSCKNEADQNNEILQQKITIYTIGDSTMANKSNPEVNPERGWCQMLPQFFNQDVIIENHAVNGRSTRSFINEGRWDSIYRKLNKGDYVFIQFGHNDQKVNDPKRFSNPHTSYRHNLIRFVTSTRQKGAHPVLISSIVRRNFNEQGTLVDTHGEYPSEVRSVAHEMEVPFIDLQYLTELMEEEYGFEGSKKLHLHFEPGEIPYYPDGKTDNTHLSVLGANNVAKLAIEELKSKVEGLKVFIKE